MDNLSKKLNNSKVGCMFKDIRLNHLFYADDTVILASTPHALQYLLKICSKYAQEHELTFNIKKI